MRLLAQALWQSTVWTCCRCGLGKTTAGRAKGNCGKQPKQEAELCRMRHSGNYTVSDLAELFNVARLPSAALPPPGSLSSIALDRVSVPPATGSGERDPGGFLRSQEAQRGWPREYVDQCRPPSVVRHRRSEPPTYHAQPTLGLRKSSCS